MPTGKCVTHTQKYTHSNRNLSPYLHTQVLSTTLWKPLDIQQQLEETESFAYRSLTPSEANCWYDAQAVIVYKPVCE